MLLVLNNFIKESINYIVHRQQIILQYCKRRNLSGTFWHTKVSHSNSHVIIPNPIPIPISSQKSLPIFMGFPWEPHFDGNSHSHAHIPQPLRGLLPSLLLGEQWVRTVCLRLLPDSVAAAI